MHLRIAIAFYIASLLLATSRASAQEQPSENTQTQPRPEIVQKVGNGVTPPRPVSHAEPEFSDQARNAHYQGTCVLSFIVGEDGKPRDIRVTQPLGMGLDQKAVEAIRTWRFEPARKDGKPVAVMIAAEVDFRLYGKADDRIAELMKKTASGDAKAEMELSTIYLEGQDVPKNQSLGLMYLERAAKHGSPQAQFLMGKYASQQHVPDYPQAYMWYTLAQRSGYKHSDKALKQLSSKMTQEQIQAGQTLVNNWINSPAR